ncbi:hypothetical protein CCAX7_48590 [Capsulimonas corticalis]|uniref:Uncharacterized protein n=1 Tax=Capsulimonas corticalis TaxID=2219043 RepID=A0A402CQ64_9BACT|nr:glycosyltransferase 87 family protein [Capsulimonas corticalis]BDI32808.1 hypothetical protein CCAX7_48590 [Capsulimonas corticalis]
MTEAPANLRVDRPLHFLIALFVLEIVAFALLQYGVPTGLQSLWATGKLDTLPFATALFGHAVRPLTPGAFRIAFRVLLVALYAVYAAILLRLSANSSITPRRALTIVIVTGAAIAILFPASLSSDLYSYVAYAKLPGYHLNPYFHSPRVLIDAGDPMAGFLPRSIRDPSKHRIAWDIPTVYGPVWTALSIGVVRMIGASQLWLALLGMKLIELGALMVASMSAGRITRRQYPDRIGAAILTIGLNPLALIEGVGSGHNDLLMIAFALLAAALLQERKPLLGGLALGVSIGVKFVTLALLPWLLIDLWKSSQPKMARVSAMAAFCAGAAAPVILCFAPFWHGLATLGALANRNQVIQKAGASATDASHGLHHGVLFSALHEHQTILILYAALTIAVALFRIRDGWVWAWTIFSSAFIYYSMGIWFPWYLLWPWLVMLACGARTPGRAVIAFAIGAVALTLTTFYTIASGAYALRLLEAVFYLCAAGSGLYFIGILRRRRVAE